MFVSSNLYVDGTIFCNGLDSVVILGDSSQVVGTVAAGTSVIDVSQPMHVAELFLDRVHFGASNYTVPATPPVLNPSEDPSQVLLAEGLYYDSSWTLSRSKFENVEEPIAVGNGKLLVQASPFMLTGAGPLLYNGPMREIGGNCYKTFDPLNIRLFEKCSPETIINAQRLNMRTGILTTDNVIDTVIETSCDLLVARHIPNVILQTFRLRPTLSKMSQVRFTHDFMTSEDLTNVDYSNDLLYDPRISDRGISTFMARGTHRELGKVVSLTCYIFDDPFISGLGMNAPGRSKDPLRLRCQNAWDIHLLDPLRVSRVSLLHVILSEVDIRDPEDEARKIALTLLSKESNVHSSIRRLREDHVKASAEVWATSVAISAKCSESRENKKRAIAHKKLVRFALYNIYSVSRFTRSSSERGDMYPIMDVYGSVLGGGDMILLPLLVQLKPNLALSVLEYRHRNIESSIRLAEMLGFAGAKIKDTGDSERRWDSSSSCQLFNSALVACNAWSLYRVLRNKDWLRTKGYTIISSIATFLASTLELDPATCEYTSVKTYGVAGIESTKDNAFTNTAIRLAMRAAIEASWELSLEPDEAWLAIHETLKVPTFSDKVPMFDLETTDRYSTFPILEPLFLAMPQFGECENIARLTNYWSRDRISPERADDPLNTFLLGVAYGRLAQSMPEYIDRFESQLSAFVGTCSPSGAWGNLAFRQSHPVPDTQVSTYSGGLDTRMFPCPWLADYTRINDPLLSAMAVQLVTQGIVKLEVLGGVAETRFYYDEMRISASITAVMPNIWDKVTVAGGGKGGKGNFRCTNALFQ